MTEAKYLINLFKSEGRLNIHYAYLDKFAHDTYQTTQVHRQDDNFV